MLVETGSLGLLDRHKRQAEKMSGEVQSHLQIPVTGCSCNGKDAFMASAFDTHVVFTIPLDSDYSGNMC